MGTIAGVRRGTEINLPRPWEESMVQGEKEGNSEHRMPIGRGGGGGSYYVGSRWWRAGGEVMARPSLYPRKDWGEESNMNPLLPRHPWERGSWRENRGHCDEVRKGDLREPKSMDDSGTRTCREKNIKISQN